MMLSIEVVKFNYSPIDNTGAYLIVLPCEDVGPGCLGQKIHVFELMEGDFAASYKKTAYENF